MCMICGCGRADRACTGRCRGNRRVWLREMERERIGREIWEGKPRGWVFSIWLMPRMRVHMWRTAVSDSCPAQLLPSTFDRTHIYSWRERGGGEKGLFSPLTLGYAPERYPHVATPTRAILCPEYMTRSTHINWHYGYDVVSLATVTRPLSLPTTAQLPRVLVFSF